MYEDDVQVIDNIAFEELSAQLVAAFRASWPNLQERAAAVSFVWDMMAARPSYSFTTVCEQGVLWHARDTAVSLTTTDGRDQDGDLLREDWISFARACFSDVDASVWAALAR